MKTSKLILWARALVLAVCCAVSPSVQSAERVGQPPKVAVEPDGTVRVPAYDLPLSIYMSDEAKRAYINQSLHSPVVESSNDIASARNAVDRVFLKPHVERAKEIYPVEIEEKEIAGVRTYVVVPKGGVAKLNEERVLLNIHGGGLSIGSGMLQLIESIPVASTAKIKVISIDYRLAPEHKFPAPLQDITVVYKELLKEYRPESIGIYGHSVGGALPAMLVAWLQREKLPRPGAIGMLSPSNAISGGDSRYTAPPLDPQFGLNSPPPPASPNPPPHGWAKEYFSGMDLQDPVISPTLHPEVLAQFPPTLLITGTRDFLASTTIYTHRQLVKAGVDAELQVWDGMWHGFILEVDIPEVQEMCEVVAKFFNTHLR